MIRILALAVGAIAVLGGCISAIPASEPVDPGLRATAFTVHESPTQATTIEDYQASAITVYKSPT